MSSRTSAVNWVSVVGLFRPSQILFSQRGDWFVNLICLEPTQRLTSGKSTTDVIRLRAASFDALKQMILDRWPQANFSVVKPEGVSDPVEDARAAYLAEKPRVEDNSIGAIRKKLEAVFPVGTRVTRSMAAQHLSRVQLDVMFGADFSGVDEVDNGLTPEEKANTLRENVLTFMRSDPWLVSHPDFFRWSTDQPDFNWQQLKSYLTVLHLEGSVEEIGRGYRFLRDSNCLHLQSSYKRSEEFQRPRAFTAQMVAKAPVDTNEVRRKLAKFSGRTISRELALTVCSVEEIDALQQEKDTVKADAIAKADARSSFTRK